MDIEFYTESVEQVNILAVGVFSFQDHPFKGDTASSLPSITKEQLVQLKNSGEITGKPFELTLLHKPQGLSADRLLIVGAGKKKNFDIILARKLAGTASRYLRKRGINEFAWLVEQESEIVPSFQLATEGIFLANFDVGSYQTEVNNASSRDISRVLLLPTKDIRKDDAQKQINTGCIIGRARNWARKLVNEPSNILTPTSLAEETQALLTNSTLDVEVLGPEKVQELKMGAFYSVAQGSDEPLRLITVKYEPKESPKQPIIGLIGKGVTFDSGGISIKPSNAMHEMKTDMAGAATMLAVMQAISQLKPNVRIIAVIPAAENLPSGRAQKPGDILTSMSGKTIEILNTDAEGRLLLADALTYARQIGCTHLIDAATLTGAVVVALGDITTGVFGWDQSWVNKTLDASRKAGEKFWQLPIDNEYRPQYKSMIADLANTGGRYGGAITAAMFIGEFAEETPWLHLDIAGTRWTNKESSFMSKGATGVGVPTLIQLLMNFRTKDS